WALDSQDLDTAVRMLRGDVGPGALTEVSFALGPAAEAAVAIPGASEHPDFPAILERAAWAAHRRDERQLAVRLCEEGRTAEQRLGMAPRPGISLARAQVALAEGNLHDAIEHAEYAEQLARAHGETRMLAVALSVSANHRFLVGDTGFIPQAEEAVVLARRVANPGTTASVFGMAGFVLAGAQPPPALRLLREAVEVAAPLGRHQPFGLWVIAGDVASRQGNRRDALQFFDQGIDDHLWFGNRRMLASALGRLADELADTDPASAAVLYGALDALPPYTLVTQHARHARQRA